jgi:hypothetical protein
VRGSLLGWAEYGVDMTVVDLVFSLMTIIQYYGHDEEHGTDADVLI